VNFSEPVTNVDLTTILVTGGEATVALNEAGDEATVSIDAEQGAEVTVTVTTAITDIPHERGVSGELVEVANNLVAEVSETYVVGDWTAPELLSMTPEEDNNTETEFTVELVFSEEVEGVEESVTVEGGTLVDVEVDEADAKVYHVMVEGEDLDSITVTVDPAGIDDGPVNNNGLVLAEGVDGVGEYVVGDHVAPEIVSVVADVDDVENTPQAFTVDITFSEAVENTDLGITVDGAAAVYTVAGNVYTVEIEGEHGDVITLAVTDVITDVSINENPLANPGTWVYTVGDNTPPVVEVYKPSATDTINEFDLTITFNEEVTGVDVNSVTVTGVTPVDPEVELRVVLSGLVYEATINAIDGDEVTLSFSDAIEDLAGNPLVPASFVYTIANEAPTVMADPAEGVNLENGDHTVTLTFSEPVLNAETGVVVTNALSSSIAMVSETVYEVTFEGAEESTVEIEVTDAVTDLAGEPVVPVTFTYQIDDNTAPEIVSVIPQGENATANTFVLDIVFSEPVWGTAEGMSIMGGTGMTITTGEDGDQIYQVTITGNDGDDIILTIGDEIVDGAGIPNPLAEEGTFYYTVGDNTPPTLEVTTLPDPQQTEFDVMLTFSEEVTGVGHTGYISITNGEITNINGSEGDKVYILTIAAEEEAEVLLQLSTYIKDLAGNAFAGESMTFEVGDWTAPAATAMTPEGELEEDDTTFDLVLTLDEDVVAGSGNLTVMDDNGAFLTFTPAEVTISGNTVTVPVVLDKYTTYRVVVDEGFVTDEAGNDFEGVADGDWTFTTKNFAVGIDSKEYTYKVYPNPFNDYVTIDNAHRLSRVVISNIAGQRVIDVMYPEQVVRTPNLVSGAYLITLFTEEGIVKTERIVKR
jgi:methionine-rich copper-binding protein CopC